MSETGHAPREWIWKVAGVAAIAAFLLLAGRFWHPYYGFTKFVQLDEADARAGIHEVREHPVFAYEGFNGYDGAAYAQIAFHPLLDSAELQPALGNVPYRARRILGSALAWVLSAGEPSRIANTYAGLNLAVWLGLAWLLWRILAVNDARSWLAWSGVLFSAGSLHSVRLALTDLLAATLATGAIAFAEGRRDKGGIGLLAMAGLARETALAAVVGFWRGPWKTPRAWVTNVFISLAVAAPLMAWMAYVRWKAGPAAQGLGNFTWPVMGWLEKWVTTFRDFEREPSFRWLNTATLLAVVALTAQAVYFIRRREGQSPWWRVGLVGVAMMALLGTSVWEGHPGAATRVLLPMSIAFAVVVVRHRASLGWVFIGSASVWSGVLALWQVPHDSREIAAGRFARGSYVVRLAEGWYGVERHHRSAWSWAPQQATLTLKTAPRTSQRLRVRLKLRAISPRTLEVRHGNAPIWSGSVDARASWIEMNASAGSNGELQLELSSLAPAVAENQIPASRQLGFALYDVQLSALPWP
jgi:hypothetical protein